jgi:hypothetical protein
MVIPLLGALPIVLAAEAAVPPSEDRGCLTLFSAAVFYIVAAGVITRFANKPVISTVKTWQEGTAPGNTCNCLAHGVHGTSRGFFLGWHGCP